MSYISIELKDHELASLIEIVKKSGAANSDTLLKQLEEDFDSTAQQALTYKNDKKIFFIPCTISQIDEDDEGEFVKLLTKDNLDCYGGQVKFWISKQGFEQVVKTDEIARKYQDDDE